MKVEFNGICSRFVGKTSSSGNLYYQVDLTETVETGNPDEPKKDITYRNLYLNIGRPIENHSSFVGRQVNAVITIYPQDRKVGELIYQDIKIKLDSLDIV